MSFILNNRLILFITPGEATVYVQATSKSKGEELIKPEDKVVFTRPIDNVGNAYNSKTGVFVAPVNGTYFFIATLFTTTLNAYTKFHVVHDMGGRLTTGQIGSQRWSDCENAWAATYMRKGSEAWVEYGKNSNGGYIRIATENSFTVVLISKNDEI